MIKRDYLTAIVSRMSFGFRNTKEMLDAKQYIREIDGILDEMIKAESGTRKILLK